MLEDIWDIEMTLAACKSLPQGRSDTNMSFIIYVPEKEDKRRWYDMETLPHSRLVVYITCFKVAQIFVSKTTSISRKTKEVM